MQSNKIMQGRWGLIGKSWFSKMELGIRESNRSWKLSEYIIYMYEIIKE